MTLTDEEKKLKAELVKQYMAEQEIISKAIFEKMGAQFLKIGKTKAIGLLPDGNVVMRFLDTYTGTDFVKDGGGNEIAGHMRGLGKMNLEMSSKLFCLLEKNCDIPNQNIYVDIKNNILVADAATLLAKDMPFEAVHKGKEIEGVGIGTEFLYRNFALGSYLDRNPHKEKWQDLRDKNGNGLVETSVKFDPYDPVLPWEYFARSGKVSVSDLGDAMDMTERGAKYLTQKFQEQDMIFADTKFEFGLDKRKKLILVDEISTGTSRVFKPNKKDQLNELEVYDAVMRM